MPTQQEYMYRVDLRREPIRDRDEWMLEIQRESDAYLLEEYKKHEVAFVVDGVRDYPHSEEIFLRLQQLKYLHRQGTDSLGHIIWSRGSRYRGNDCLYVISPILDVVDVANRIDFGRVTGVDVKNRTILVDAGAELTECPAAGWPGSEAIDQFVLERTVAAASVAADQSLVDKYGSDRVFVILVPEESVNADGVHSSPDLHPLVLNIRKLAPESLATTDYYGPREQAFVTITVAPVFDVASFLFFLGEELPIVVDESARVMLFGDIDRLRPRTPVPVILMGNH